MLHPTKFTLAALFSLASLSAHAAPPEKTASGLIYESLKDGTGAQATPDAEVNVLADRTCRTVKK